MSEVLQRIAYDATVEDAVDVSWRLANRTHAFRRQIQINLVCAGIGSGLAFFAAWMYIVGASPLNLVLAAVAGTIFGIVFAAIFRRALEREIRKQHRKVIAEQFGGKPLIQSELELRPDAVWVRQAGMEMVFPWILCTGVQNNLEDIEINFTPGMCIVRNRHFASAADRAAFLETVRRLSAK
jgi:hypothetical protein